MPRAGKSRQQIVRHLPLTQARIHLGQVIRQIHTAKEYVILEKDGLPIAGLMGIDEFEDYLERQDLQIKRTVAASAKSYRQGKSRPVERLLNELRATRPAAGTRRQRRP